MTHAGTTTAADHVATLSEYTVRTIDVKRSYKMGADEVHALRGVSISIERV
jgi:hypothetical protein